MLTVVEPGLKPVNWQTGDPVVIGNLVFESA